MAPRIIGHARRASNIAYSGSRRYVSSAYQDVYFPENSLAVPFKWEAAPGRPANDHIITHHDEHSHDNHGANDDHDDDNEDRGYHHHHHHGHHDNTHDGHDNDHGLDHDIGSAAIGHHGDDDEMEEQDEADDQKRVIDNQDQEPKTDLHRTRGDTIYPLPPPPRLCPSPLWQKPGRECKTAPPLMGGFVLAEGADEEGKGEEEEYDEFPDHLPVSRFHSFRANVIPLRLLHTNPLHQRSLSFNHSLTKDNKTKAQPSSPPAAMWRHTIASSALMMNDTRLKLKDFLQQKLPAEEPFLTTTVLQFIPATKSTTARALKFFVTNASTGDFVEAFISSKRTPNHGKPYSKVQKPDSPTKSSESQDMASPPCEDAYEHKEVIIVEATPRKELSIKPHRKIKPSFSHKLKLFLCSECTMCWTSSPRSTST